MKIEITKEYIKHALKDYHKITEQLAELGIFLNRDGTAYVKRETIYDARLITNVNCDQFYLIGEKE